MYSIGEVLESVGWLGESENECSFRSNKGATFRKILDALGIDDICFKNCEGEWSFNDEGKAFFLDAVKKKADKVYKSIRSGHVEVEYMQKYSWMLACSISNLEDNIENARECGIESEEIRIIYPSAIDVRAENIITMSQKCENGIFSLPWMYELVDRVDEFNEAELWFISRDIMELEDIMGQEFDVFYAEYIKKREELVDKWVEYIKKIIAERLKDRDKFNARLSEEIKSAADTYANRTSQIPEQPEVDLKKEDEVYKGRKIIERMHKENLIEFFDEVIKNNGIDNLPEILSTEELVEKIKKENL